MTQPFSSDRDPSFRFAYDVPTIRFGPGCVADLATELERHGLERALVVCGSTVGSTPAVIDPVTDGLGDRLVGVFDETTPEKRLATAFDACERLEHEGADVLVAVGGGSSLDVATVAGVLAATDRDRESIYEAFAETGTIDVPEEGVVPIVTIPTTLAGADLSNAAGITAGPESGFVDAHVGGGVFHPSLMPAAAFYDPDIVATTPEPVLAGSAMNGFDKGIETIYAATATPVTDATAARGLGVLADGLEAFGAGERDAETVATILEGLVLVQFGISRPDESTLSIVHAFGHGLTEGYDVQQGAAHAVVVPHVLEYLLGSDASVRRELLADALGVGEADDPGEAIVERVREVRNALDVPTRLRDVDGPEPAAFTEVAETILADRLVTNAPPGLEPTVDEIEDVLEAAW
ncbi:iron-containing alcohol dehydrogenase family protein [Halopiger goleimassiliensis]|uniref:iron-containing alcohol dehydrogenase family protein n=1 Tax=Halopiger goleimassiliensis TaxID=1293048 RepID=UPI000677CFC8|nr:iron-containing alcohol dehydrogenase family protein [Halopiger goleimassiliensis]